MRRLIIKVYIIWRPLETTAEHTKLYMICKMYINNLLRKMAQNHAKDIFGIY